MQLSGGESETGRLLETKALSQQSPEGEKKSNADAVLRKHNLVEIQGPIQQENGVVSYKAKTAFYTPGGRLATLAQYCPKGGSYTIVMRVEDPSKPEATTQSTNMSGPRAKSAFEQLQLIAAQYKLAQEEDTRK